MMKKLMVLSLVLAVCGLANAGLSLTADGSVAKVASDDGLAYVAWIVVELPADVTEFAITELGLPASNLSSADDYGIVSGSDIGRDDLGAIRAINFTISQGVGDAAAPLLPGVHFVATVNAPLFDMGSGPRVLLMSEDFSEVLGTLYTVPEPMTMGLLGLGALFLRKRK